MLSPRVKQFPIAISPLHVAERQCHRGSGRNCLREYGVDIIDIHVQSRGNTGRHTSRVMVFVCQHDDRIADENLCMHDLPARSTMDFLLRCAERLLIE